VIGRRYSLKKETESIGLHRPGGRVFLPPLSERVKEGLTAEKKPMSASSFQIKNWRRYIENGCAFRHQQTGGNRHDRRTDNSSIHHDRRGRALYHRRGPPPVHGIGGGKKGVREKGTCQRRRTSLVEDVKNTKDGLKPSKPLQLPRQAARNSATRETMAYKSPQCLGGGGGQGSK